MRAIFEPGRHAVIYGARGVGKTSLANIVTSQLAPAEDTPAELERLVVTIRCTRDDDFDSLWIRACSRLEIVPVGNAESAVSILAPGEDRSPFDVAGGIGQDDPFVTPPKVVEVTRGAARLVFVFDEFDAIPDEATRAAFADLLKQLSDEGEGPTVVIVGIASDVEALVGHHESIQRCTEQIFMPPMSADEIATLVNNGFALLQELTIDESAIEVVQMLSRGYPAFAHSLCKVGCELAIRADRPAVAETDVVAGAIDAVEAVPYSLGGKYELAADNRHPADQTRLTLVAAAWCPMQRFRPADVLRVLTDWGIESTLQNVTNHLKRLTEPARGGVLRSLGESHPSYAFADPMFVPYVVIQFVGELPPPAKH